MAVFLNSFVFHLIDENDLLELKEVAADRAVKQEKIYQDLQKLK